MTYRDDQVRLADQSQQQVANLYAAYQTGKLTHEQFKAAALQVMLVMMAAANKLADVTLAKLVSQNIGTEVVATGVVSSDASDRLDKALDTVLANPNSDMAIRRLANSATLEAAQLGWGNALRNQPGVNAWTRQTRPGACDICQKLTGSVLSLSTPMYHHPGCTCIQKPVFSNQQISQ